MATLKQVRDDLNEIRYYYSRKEYLSSLPVSLAENDIAETAHRYGDAMTHAPYRLYDLYTCLYLNNNTQASLSDQWGYTPENIKYLNNKLCRYLQAAL